MKGLCECGCGKPTPIARATNTKLGHVAGQPVRFSPGHHPLRPIEDRFWPKVDRSGGPEACWPWTGGRNAKGYGSIGRGRTGEGRVYAHRLSYELAVGPIPRDLQVCHRCDNPPCVNQAHLFVGTQKDNMQDCTAKGRQAPPEVKARKGEANGRAVLSPQEVLAIRSEYVKGSRSHGSRQLAKKYGVSDSQVRLIARGGCWKEASL